MSLSPNTIAILGEGIASAHGVTLFEILSRSRRKEHVRARRELAVALFGSGWTYSHIGRAIGRHHTTVCEEVFADLGKKFVLRRSRKKGKTR